MKNRKPKADGRYVVNVSFTEQEKNLLDYADSQGGFTNYVKALIKKDMNKGTEEVPSWMMDLLKNNFQNTQPKETPPPKKKVDVGAINSILGKKF